MKQQIAIFFIIFSLVPIAYASSIRKCRQSDGSLLFTNKPCPMATRSFSKVYSKKRKVPPFRQANFVRLQKTMIQAKSAEIMELRAQVIMDKALSLAKQGRMNNAYDMVAASYAKLSTDIKNRHWNDQPISHYSLKIRGLFEEVLISQSTTSTAIVMENIVQAAWKNYHLIVESSSN